MFYIFIKNVQTILYVNQGIYHNNKGSAFMKNKDKQKEPNLTFSDDWGYLGFEVDKNDGKDPKILESPFSNNDDRDNKDR
ncbi:hypothetical protein HMPREF1982_01478 [Clostridiales bacterium oral taxon 876 str. F0540]|nr:hypothetical protein HMPREF1982_01478 [Clostridiales bacterium oral taxon 876 str. F0540]